jgi:tetratricopeptide (TPR) repeat protein
LVAISAAALLWRRRFPYLFVGWFWYLGMMVPVIGLVQVGSHAMADRYTYLPQIGLCLSLTWGIAQLTASWRYRLQVCGVAALLVIVILMGFAWRQTSYWRNGETLWRRALIHGANSHIVLNNLGNTLVVRGKFDEALVPLRRSLEIKPDSAEGHNNLANALAGSGQIDEAIAHYRKSLEIRPGAADTHYNLGIALAGRGQVDEAVFHFRKVLEINPNDVEARHNLNLALRQGQRQ